MPLRCDVPGCGWTAVVPSEAAAEDRYREHLKDEHVSTVDAEIPDGMVQVRVDGEWRNVTREEARAYHERPRDD